MFTMHSTSDTTIALLNSTIALLNAMIALLMKNEGVFTMRRRKIKKSRRTQSRWATERFVFTLHDLCLHYTICVYTTILTERFVFTLHDLCLYYWAQRHRSATATKWQFTIEIVWQSDHRGRGGCEFHIPLATVAEPPAHDFSLRLRAKRQNVRASWTFCHIAEKRRNEKSLGDDRSILNANF